MDKSTEKQTEKKQETAESVLKRSLDATQEFFDIWTKSYQSTFGKFAQVPTIGPIREKQEKMMKSFPLYVNLYATWIDSNVNFQNVLMEATRKVYEKTINDIKIDKDMSPEKYKDLYKMWIDTYSETFKEFMKSGHYATDMGKLTTQFIDFQTNNKEMIEENFLKPGNFPTKTDIDVLNKELYSLKKEIKELEKDIRELKKSEKSKEEQKSEKSDADEKKSEKSEADEKKSEKSEADEKKSEKSEADEKKSEENMENI